MVDYLAPLRARARPAAAVDRDAAARLRPGAARRPHASRRGDRAHLDARRARSSPRRRSATRRSGSTTSGRASTCRGGSRELLEENPRGARRAAREARARHLGRDAARRATARRSSSSRARPQAIDDAARRRLRPRRPEGRASSATTRRRRCSPPALPALRGALLADADGVDPRGRPEPRGGRVRLVGARARGEPDRRAVPRPPDQHEAQAARRRRSTPRRDGRRRARARRSGDGVAEYAALVPRLLRAQPRRRDAAVPDRPGRAARRRSSRASASSRAARDAGRARFARDLYHRAIAVEDAADALGGFRSLSEAEAFAIEYWPLERYKLAQAPPRGELAGRVALDHRRRERHRPRDRAPARRARRARRRRRPERARAPQEVADEIVAAHGLRRALAVAVDVTDEDAVRRADRRGRCSPTAASTSSSPRPASPRARRSPRRRSTTGSATTPCSPAATSSPRARRSAC